MKNFMAVVLVVLLSGCGSALKTDNPHYQNAQDIAITTVSALGGYHLFGKSIWGGIITGAAGHQVAKGIQWQPGDDEYDVVHVGSGQYASQYGPYGYGGNVVCDTTPDRFGWQPEPGMCKDGMGGQTTYEDLVRRAQRDAGYYSRIQAPIVTQQQVVHPSNLWEKSERSEKRQNGETQKSSRLNPGNYLDKGAVHQACQTGNLGMDSSCLREWSDALAKLQTRCVQEKLVDSPDCRKNPGILAGEAYALSEELRKLQEKKQGFAINTVPR